MKPDYTVRKKMTVFSTRCPFIEESESDVAQLCPTLCDPMDCSLLRSSIHGIFQTRVLEWVAISFSRESSRPRDRTWVSCTVGRRFTIWATREVLYRRRGEKTTVDWWIAIILLENVNFNLYITQVYSSGSPRNH